MKWHRKIAALFGYELLRKKKMAHLNVNSHVARIFAHAKVDHVIDVGANVGQYGDELRGSGFEGDIWSFEPVASNFQLLQQKAAKDPKWHVFHCALGSEAGELAINLTDSSTFASFLAPNEFSEKRFSQQTQVNGTESVPVRRLDEMWGEMFTGEGEQRVFLKMDTQGYDLEVFMGATGVLDKIVGLQSEISMIPIYEGMPDYSQSLDAYLSKGFKVTGIYPVSRDHESMAVIEFDVVMIQG